MAFFLGIDGGGTKTDCAVGDEVSRLGRADAGSCKIFRVGREAARQNLLQAVERACDSAKVGPRRLDAVCIGISGESIPEVVEWTRATLAEVTPAAVQVAGDNEIAHAAAFHGEAGVLVIAGTGSVAYGRNERGETARAGGWGPLVSDEGSGEWIGRAAVSAALRAFDSGQSTRLFQAILGAWGVSTREEMVAKANSNPPPEFPALFPEVLAVADAGDAMAGDILHRAGVELAALAGIVIRRLWPGTGGVRVATSGGVLRNSGLVRQVFHNSLKAKRRGVTVFQPEDEAVEGALWLARRVGRK